MLSLERVRQISVAEYYKMGEIEIFAPDERVELLDGIIYKKEHPAPLHAWTVNVLTEVLCLQFSEGYAVWTHNPIILSDYSVPEPDTGLIRERRKGEPPFLPRPKDVYLVVEVTDTPTNRNFDLTLKLPLYARAEIPEVWVVDATASLIEQYLLPQNGAYQVMNVWRSGDTIPTSLGVGIEVDGVLL